MNGLKMDDIDRVLREREITRSLTKAPRREKGRPMLAVIDKKHEEIKLEQELKGLDNYA